MAELGIRCLAEGISRRGWASLVLTGGSSPGLLYARWAEQYAEAIDWSKVHFFWGDERDVPHDHADSNTQTTKPLLIRLNVDPEKVHAWRTDLEVSEALGHMDSILKELAIGEHGFDLVLLGVGEDGHIASLFPKHRPWQDLADVSSPWLRHIEDSPKPPSQRYTFTFPVLNKARVCFLLPFGENKRPVLSDLREGCDHLPVCHVEAREQLYVFTDQD